MTTQDTSSFFTTHQTRDVPRDQYGRYKLPGPDGPETSWTRATTFAATLAEQYGLRIWKERQVVWGLSRRPDLITMASTIVGPEDKKALGEIVTEAHIAAGTDAKANRGTAIHLACVAAEAGAFERVPEELRPHVAGYFKAMRDGGLEILPQYVERTGIVKQYGVAGTLDNLVRCPDGKVRVADKKTGRMDYSDTEFAVQMALYAHFDALFNYGTNSYEPMPDVATDYAILAHIDPETGHTELLRINIEWGWVWARTCAEVRDIRDTKHVITPYVPPEWEGFGSPPGFEMKIAERVDPQGWVEGDDSSHVWIDSAGSPHDHPGPLGRCDCSKGPRSPLADRMIAEQPGAAQRSADALQMQTETPGDPVRLPPVPAEVAEAAQIMHAVNANANGQRAVPGAFVDTKITVPVIPSPGEPFTIPTDPPPNLSEIERRARQQYGGTAQLSVSRAHDGTLTAVVDPSSAPGADPWGGRPTDNSITFVDRNHYPVSPAAVDLRAEYQAFWSDDLHDEDGDEQTVNGVPLEQYGAASKQWGCFTGQPCEFTGDDGLHSDGTVCLYGNARPGPIPPMPSQPGPDAMNTSESTVIRAEHSMQTDYEQGMADLDSSMIAARDAVTIDPDELVAKIDGLKGGKAAVQNVARRLMAKLGIKEGDPGSIKLNQYKIKVARACVDLAHKHNVSIPGAKDDQPDFGVPSGPAPTGDSATNSAGVPAPKKAQGDAGATEVLSAQAPDPAREEKLRTAVRSIMACGSIEQLQKVHTHYSGTSLGWTDEMQTAARTRALELEQSGEESPLTPLEMIQGATSRETLTKAWEKATQGGTDMAGWTEELNAAALAKQTELSGGGA